MKERRADSWAERLEGRIGEGGGDGDSDDDGLAALSCSGRRLTRAVTRWWNVMSSMKWDLTLFSLSAVLVRRRLRALIALSRRVWSLLARSLSRICLASDLKNFEAVSLIAEAVRL